MRWVADQGVPKLVVAWLRGQGHDVLEVAVSPLRGSPDRVLWQVAAEEQRLVITRDIGFVPAQSPPLPPGVILIRAPHWFRAGDLSRLVKSALADMPLGSLLGFLTVIQPGRVRQRALSSVTGRHLGQED